MSLLGLPSRGELCSPVVLRPAAAIVYPTLFKRTIL